MDTVKIGWGRREISMDGPVSIPGQMHVRISRGVLDPLYATAVCVDGGAGQKAVIFCSVDVVVLGKNKVNLYDGNEVLQLKGSKRFNALKYVNFFHKFKNSKEGKTNGKFLGL